MKHYMTAVLALLLLMGVSVPSIYAAEKTRMETPPGMLDVADKEKLVNGAKAVEQNRVLEALAGKWDFNLKYFSHNGAAAETSTGTATNDMVLDGRFLSSNFKVMLNIGGENIIYKGWSIEGYDTVKKAYTSVLVDTMRAGMTAGAGQYNEKTKTLEEKGSFTHPLMAKERKYRAALEFTGDDTYRRSVFIPDAAGKEFKVLEIDYRRHM